MPVEALALTPLEALGERMEVASRSRARETLGRHSHRLTSAERAYYEEEITSVPKRGLAPLRRRLHNRLFRSFAKGARIPLEPASGENLGSGEDSTGPYNDRAVLEETLRRAARVDPNWVAELTDLAAGVRRLRMVLGIMPVPAR